MIDMKIIEEAAKAACVGLINKEYFAAKIKFIEGAEWYGKQVEDIVSNAVLADSSILPLTHEDLKHGEWVFTPDEVFGSGGMKSLIFQYDERINYTLDFGHKPRFYRVIGK